MRAGDAEGTSLRRLTIGAWRHVDNDAVEGEYAPHGMPLEAVVERGGLHGGLCHGG